MTPATFFAASRQLLRAALAATVIGAAAPVLAAPLIIASPTGFQTFDAHNALVPGAELGIVSQLYSSLLVRDHDLTLRGDLAESWEAIDPTTWRFKLREGVTFPNGEALDADVVKWNIDRVIDPELNVRSRNWFTLIERVEVVSPTEVDIITKEPFGALPEQLTLLFMMSPKWVAETADITMVALGTGPYRLDAYTPGDSVVLSANPDYYGKHPDFDQVTIRIVPDAAARVAGFLAGELDVVTEILPVDMATIEASGVGTPGWTPGNRSMVLKFNHEKEPMQNLQLRQAINYAIDKQSIIDTIYEGMAQLSQCQVLTPAHVGYNPDLAAFPYDPDKARALLAESGLPQPVNLVLEVPTGRYLLSPDTAQVVAAQLEEVGINVTLQEMEFTTWMQTYANTHDMGQMSILSQGYPTIDAGGVLNLFRVKPPTSYWADETFDALVQQSQTAISEGDRLAAFAAATQRMCDEAAAAFLFALPVTYAVSKKVDWTARPDDWVRPSEMALR